MTREKPIQASFDEPTWTCPSCSGSGRHPDDTSRMCFMCLGSRIVLMDPEDFSVIPY